MNRPPRIDVTMAEARQALADAVLTEIEIGLTLLDVAAISTDHGHAQRTVDHAITALRTAGKLMSQIQPGNVNIEAIQRRREMLVRRLRTVADVDESSGR